MPFTDLNSWFGSPHLGLSNAPDLIRIHRFPIELHLDEISFFFASELKYSLCRQDTRVIRVPLHSWGLGLPNGTPGNAIRDSQATKRFCTRDQDARWLP